MAESSAINSEEIANCEIEIETNDTARVSVKKEEEVNVKPEPHDCIVCSIQSNETNDIFTTKTTVSHVSLNHFLFKFTNVNVAGAQSCTKYMCRTCYDLINVLEQAELEYLRLKQTLEEIISKNPLYQAQSHEVQLEAVKSESFGDDYDGSRDLNKDSEDEPLSVTKKKRYGRKKKQLGKRKITLKKERWECNICGEQGTVGGLASEAAHRLVKHSIQEEGAVIADVKKEDYADGSQSPSFVNGFDDADESMFKVELETDDDDSPNFLPDDLIKEGKKEKKPRIILGRKAIHTSAAPMPKKRKKREAKAIHKCDKCSSTFTSLSRLECHLQKHEDSKPPYICEICGAHYKHKRACDIHIALHKGISDWKCEECNKLFPSKGALQRHNNIHTGKSNYQCDLCGKSFIHTSSFKMHKLSHSGVKPHACDVCGLALMTRSHLKRHKRVHSGEKRHECNVCGKRFSERYNLAAHSKSHEPAAAATPPPAEPAPRRRLFRCNFCQERFERRYMLERHMSAVHGRALERPPPTPRNTMSKLLKAQAQRRDDTQHADTHRDNGTSTKQEPSPEPQTPQKLITITTSIPPSAWSNAYAAEFGIPRADFPH